MSQDYEIDIVPLTPEDGGGFADIAPELPGCRSDGDEIGDAVRLTKGGRVVSARLLP